MGSDNNVNVIPSAKNELWQRSAYVDPESLNRPAASYAGSEYHSTSATNPTAVNSSSSTNGKAIASLILGILAFVNVVPIIGAIISIVLGNSAVKEINNSEHLDFTGLSLARWGRTLSWISLIMTVLGIALIVLVALMGGFSDVQVRN